MLKSDGICRIDSVHVGEGSFNMLGPSPTLSAKSVLINSASGSRFGSSNRNQWSEQTMLKLVELTQLMEQDIAAELFDGASTTASVTDPLPNTTDGVPGL